MTACSEAGIRSCSSPERAFQATTVAGGRRGDDDAAVASERQVVPRTAADSDGPGEYTGVRAQPDQLAPAPRPGPDCLRWTASSRPSGENGHRRHRGREAQPAHDRARAHVADRDGARVAAGREPAAVGREGDRLRRRSRRARGGPRCAAWCAGRSTSRCRRHGLMPSRRRAERSRSRDWRGTHGVRARRSGDRRGASPPGPRRSRCRRTRLSRTSPRWSNTTPPSAALSFVPYVSTTSLASTSHTAVVSSAAATIRLPSRV